MEKVNIKLLKTSRNYAAALFETAEKQNATNSVLNDIDLISKTLFENSNLNDFLKNPIIDLKDKKSAIEEIFNEKILKISKNFLLLLADNSRFDIFFDIEKEYKNLIDKSNNKVVVKAVSAIPVKDYLKYKLQSKLEFLLSKKVEIQYEINPEIIGGLIIETEGKVIDNSVQTQLNKIKKQLI